MTIEAKRNWKFTKHTEGEKYSHYTWTHKGGDTNLSIALIGMSGNGKAWFELCRDIFDPIVAQALINQGELEENAMIAIKEGKSYPYISMIGNLPEDLEKFCKRAGLPIPQEHIESWQKAKDVASQE